MKTKTILFVVFGVLFFTSIALNLGFFSREVVRTPYLMQASIYKNSGDCISALFEVSEAYGGDWKNWENPIQSSKTVRNIQGYFHALYAGGKIYDYDPLDYNSQIALQIMDQCVSEFENKLERGYVIPDAGSLANFVLPVVQTFYGKEGFSHIRKMAKV